jgi:hypothetical protein
VTPPWLTPRRALVGLAAASLLGAVVAVLPGWLVPGFVVALAGSSLASSSLVVVVAAGLAGLYGLRVLTDDEDDADRRDRRPAVRFPSRPPEVAVHDVRRVVGEDVNAAASSADADEPWRRRRHLRRTHARLRAAAVDAVTEATGCPREVAARLVAEGRWTDRPRARAYLAEDAAIRRPLRTRVRDWAAGERTERAVRDTVGAILAVRDGDADHLHVELLAVESADDDGADADARDTAGAVSSAPPAAASPPDGNQRPIRPTEAEVEAEADGGRRPEGPRAPSEASSERGERR